LSTGELLDPPRTAKYEFGIRLLGASNLRVAEAVIESSASGKLSEKFRVALSYRYLSLLHTIKAHLVFEEKFPRKKISQIWLGESCFAALGFALGAKEIAVQTVELLLAAIRHNFCFAKEKWPIFHFIGRLYCDFQGKSYPLQDYPTHPILEATLAEWRTQDLKKVENLLLAACDHHTQRARPDNRKEFFEFNSGWRLYPVEILMVLRLRQYIGLLNPELDHPIMKFPWSVLGPEMPAEPDELLRGVLDRAKADEGFDPEALYHQIVQ
jgi:hypothetical protein